VLVEETKELARVVSFQAVSPKDVLNAMHIKYLSVVHLEPLRKAKHIVPRDD
jgi:hypothetical protein